LKLVGFIKCSGVAFRLFLVLYSLIGCEYQSDLVGSVLGSGFFASNKGRLEQNDSICSYG
jgi:hypothetical protein